MKSLFALSLLLCSCLPNEVKETIKTTSEVVVVSEVVIVKEYELEQRRCLQKASDALRRACVEEVRRDYGQIKDLYEAIRQKRCRLEPERCR